MYLLLALNLTLALTGIAPSNLTVGAVVAQFAQLSNYYMLRFGESHIIPATGPLWSLSVEEHFYLIYPLLFIVLQRRFSQHNAALAMLPICAVVLAWRCYLVYVMGVSGNYTYEATDTRFDSLLFGCIMGLAFNPAIDENTLNFGERVWIAILLASFGLLALCIVIRDEAFRATFRYTIQGIALAPVFFCAIRYSDWPMFRWLNYRWVRRLGIISYSFYLIHLTALAQAANLVRYNHVLTPILGFLMAVAFSTLVYFLVEKPLGKLRRQLHR